MADAPGGKRDFFVSFNQADRAWATWIAWTLKEAGYSVWFQDWDFQGSVAAAMALGHRAATHTLAVLSDGYLGSWYCRAEWEMRFHEDADGALGQIVPFRVAPCTPDALLDNLAWRDLFGLDEQAARTVLLDRARQALDRDYRPGADQVPRFPGIVGPLAPAAKPRFPVAVNNLPHANPDFVGREEVLAELRRLLTSGPGPAVLTQAITGLGGIGKTQAALAYAHCHLADYELVWWLHAETSAALAADYASLAAPLGLDPETQDQAALTAAIRARLQATPGWLLVFDNVEDPALPRAWLPTTGGGHALVTSRRTDWRGLARALPLELMQEAEALQLLAGRPDPGALPAAELAAAKELAAELGRLPLALSQARAYMAETGKGLAGYLRLFRGSRPADFAADRPGPDYEAGFAVTWRISIAAAAAACPAARPLLELLTFLAADPLPAEVVGADPDALPEGLRGERGRDEATAALRRYSLVGAEAGALTVHRLVQAVARDGLDGPTAEARAEAAARLVAAAMPFDADWPSEWPKVQALLPHALAAAGHAERLGVGLAAAGAVLNQTALYHKSRAAWIEAEPLLRRALAITEEALGPDHPDLAVRLNNLAGLYQDTGRLAEAEPLLRRAVAILEAKLPPDHPSLATVRANHAVLLDHLRRAGGTAES